MIYEGAPSRQLSQLAAVMRDHLDRNFRCLYLSSPPMAAGMRSYVAAAGVDVEKVLSEGRLLLSSDQSHIVEGRFDQDRMIRALEQSLEKALQDGYAGLWATGDMTWEMGERQNFSKLLEYEWQLEKLFRQHPQLSGICQYHADTLPRTALQQGLASHPAIFVNATLSRINLNYLPPEHSQDDPDWETWLQEAMC